MPHTINNTSDILNQKITTHSLKGLILYIKQHIIQWYKHTCAIVNCYICIIYYILPHILYLGYAWRSKYYDNQICRNIPKIIRDLEICFWVPWQSDWWLINRIEIGHLSAVTRRVIRPYLAVRTKTQANKHTQIIAHGNMQSSCHELTKLILFRGTWKQKTVFILRKPVTMIFLLFCCSFYFIYCY